MTDKIDNIAGSPVEGKNFFGRSDIVAHLIDILRNDDILLLGPRRIGKTSVARAVMAAVREKQWHAVEINVAACTDELDFLRKLGDALKPELATFANKALDGLKSITARIGTIKITGTAEVSLKDAASEPWTVVANEALGLITQAEQSWLIYIDELPIMLYNIIRNDTQHGVMRVRKFLDWFRNDVRQLSGKRTLHWLISGSVGLDTLVQEHGMADTINSLNHQGLPAFSNDLAQQLLLTLAQSYQISFSDEEALNMVKAVQWPQPYYLQVVFQHFRRLLSEQPTLDTATGFEQALMQMVKPGSDNDFHHWAKRLEQQLNANDARHAKALLDKAACLPAGASASVLFSLIQARLPDADEEQARATFARLRDILLRDAYWFADESSGAKNYRFCLEPLRRWWNGRNTL